MRILSLTLAAVAGVAASEPAVTVYNGGFAVVRDRIDVALPAGVGTVAYAGASAHVEPGTALLAVPDGVQVIEHTYRNDPVSTTRLLQVFEGRTIDVETMEDNKRVVRKAKIVRAPASIHREAWNRFGVAYAQSQQALLYDGGQGANEVLLEMDGQLRFGLPGTPLFPALPPDSDLRPTLAWQVRAKAAVKGAAEVSYLCDGMRWEAAYTVIAKESGEDRVDVNGVITVDNESGTGFTAARLKFVAGDVMKLSDEGDNRFDGLRAARLEYASADVAGFGGMAARAEGRAFSDYHIYTMPDPVDLGDRQTKQLGFLDVHGIASGKRLVYDGADIDWRRYNGWTADNLRQQREFGSGSNPKIDVERVIENSAKNQLGKPLPAGIVRCYLLDRDRRPEFVGENRIDHTAEDETLRIRTGNAFDLVGERSQTNFVCESERKFVDEDYRVTVRNHRAEPAEVVVVEHLYRWSTWEIRKPSQPFTKRDSRTIEFTVTVPAKGEQTVTYQAHYTW